MEQYKIHKVHIDGLKGFACFMVMLGHYIGIYKYAESNTQELYWLDKILDSKLGFIIDETFWVQLFFVISGYLIARSKIENVKQLGSKCITRFLRLGIPILFSYSLIFCIYRTIGFHANETAELFTNTWIQKNYISNYTIMDILKSPVAVLIFNNVSLNSPYWVLREMFIGSIVIYSLTLVKKKFENNKELLFILSVTVTTGAFVLSKIVCACLVGMFLWCIENNYEEMLKTRYFPYIVTICAALLYIVSRTTISWIFFCTLIIFIPQMKILNKIFSSKIATYLGRISFGIYSFHWPIYCSIGTLIIINISDRLNVINACIVAGGISVVVTIVLAAIYNITFERVASKIVKMVSSCANGR